MIRKCHEYMKPIFISCNILNSMVSSLLPTMSEIGEISNLINEYVDNIILSSETSCSANPIEAIRTLHRICVEAEKARIVDYLHHLSGSNYSYFKSSKINIHSCIIECALESANMI